jgi:quercetin dioxygenase-like cupin family protein
MKPYHWTEESHLKNRTWLFSPAIVLMVAIMPTGLAAESAEGTGPAAIAVSFDDPAIEWGGCPEFMPEGCRIAVLHGDPSQPNADIYFEVPPDSHVPRHWHTSAERMVLVSGELHVTYDEQPTVVLKPGTYAYGPARLPHDARCAPGDPCVLFIAFEGPVDAVASTD